MQSIHSTQANGVELGLVSHRNQLARIPVHVSMGLVRPTPVRSNRFDVVCNRAPRLLRCLKQVTGPKFGFSLFRKPGADVLVSIYCGHNYPLQALKAPQCPFGQSDDRL